MWSSEEIQTFSNLSLNKLATLRAADRPFIVAGAGPMTCADRAAVLWFPVLATLTDELRREGGGDAACHHHKASPLCPPVQPHSSLLQGPSGAREVEVLESWSRKVMSALTPSIVSSHKHTKNIYCQLAEEMIKKQWWFDSTDWSQLPVSEEDFSGIWRLQVRINNILHVSFWKFSWKEVSDKQRMSKLKSYPEVLTRPNPAESIYSKNIKGIKVHKRLIEQFCTITL